MDLGFSCWGCWIIKGVHGKPIVELRSVTCHTVTCHLTQVNTSHLNPSQAIRYWIYLPWRDGRLSWPWWLGIYGDGLSVCRQSPSHLIATQPGVLIKVQHPNHCATKLSVPSYFCYYWYYGNSVYKLELYRRVQRDARGAEYSSIGQEAQQTFHIVFHEQH